jgi:pentatricopeptide repeat protein
VKELLHGMISNKYHPDIATYNTLIDGLCKNGKTEKAKELLNDMISKAGAQCCGLHRPF